MASLNEVTLIGRIGADAEIKSTKNGTTMATMSVATSNVYKDSEGNRQEKTDWHKVTIWGSMADKLAPYLNKSTLVLVKGSMHTRVFNVEGVKKSITEVRGQRVSILSSQNNESAVFYDDGSDKERR